MKPLLKATILCLLMAFLTRPLKAQDQDYVITIKGDTVKCKIKKQFLGGLRYKNGKMMGAVDISSENIRGYFLHKDNTSWQSVINEEDKHEVADSTKHEFMEVLEKGKICLFQEIWSETYGNIGYNYQRNLSSSGTNWYVSTGSDTVTQIKTNAGWLAKSRKDRKKYVAALFSDNQAVYNKFIAGDDFSFDQLRNLIHLYNTGQPYKKPEGEKESPINPVNKSRFH